jgi:broad specificity phosphatase PhoE
MGYLARWVCFPPCITQNSMNLFSVRPPCLRVVLIDRCPDGETPGESPQEMSDRVDRTIAKIRKTHQEVNIFHIPLLPCQNDTNRQAEDAASCPEDAESCDYMIFSHGHYTRCFIARWCNFPIDAGYHFSADPGCVSQIQDFRNLLFSHFRR